MSSAQHSPSSGADAGREEIIYLPHLDADPEETMAGRPGSTTENSSQPEQSHLPSGWRRTLVGEGRDIKWCYTKSAVDDLNPVIYENPPSSDIEFVPRDLYQSLDIFPDACTAVQVVEFRRETNVPLKWLPPMSDPVDIARVLGKEPESSDGWRWVHCEGLHGKTLKAVANATGWNEHKFGRTFFSTRASMDWEDGEIILHIRNQGTRIFCFYGGGKYPIFITASTSNARDSSVMRIIDFVERGCGRPEIILRKDPTLMFYGVMRAVIQDLRFSIHHVGVTMAEAYKQGVSQPSQSSLAFFYFLQDRVFVLSLDATSFRNAAIELEAAAENMHAEAEGRKAQKVRPDPKRLISERTRSSLKDTMGLLNLLCEEIPDVSHRAEAVATLGFNMLTTKTNHLLQLFAVITLSSIPFTLVTGIFGIQYFDNTRINGQQIAITLAAVGGTAMIGLLWFGFTRQREYQGYEDGDGSDLGEQARRRQLGAPRMSKIDAMRKPLISKRQRGPSEIDLEGGDGVVEESGVHHPTRKQLHTTDPSRSTQIHPSSIQRQPIKRRSTVAELTEDLQTRYPPNRSFTKAPASRPM